MVKLCTALLLMNHLTKAQADHVAKKAREAITGCWATALGCAEYLDAMKKGVTASVKYQEVHDSQGTQGEYKHTQKIASLKSAKGQIVTAIRTSMEAGGEVFGGKVSAETSLTSTWEQAWQITEETTIVQEFVFKEGAQEFLFEKVVAVNQGQQTCNFSQGVERFASREAVPKLRA